MHDMQHGKWHWGCCILPVLSIVFWVAAIIFTIFSWMSVVQNKLILNYGAQWWIVNALIFGLLALYRKGRHCCCGTCGVEKHDHDHGHGM